MPASVRRAKAIYSDILQHHHIGVTSSPLSSTPSSPSPSSSDTELNLPSDASLSNQLFTLKIEPNASPPQPTTPVQKQQQQHQQRFHTTSHRKKRTLEDAVVAIAESCKRQQTDENSNAMVQLISSMQQSQQQFQLQLMQMQQQQQQQQQFVIQLLSKIGNIEAKGRSTTHTES